MDTQEQFNKVYKKLDKIISNQHKIELKLTKKVDRNTFILNAMLWVICAVSTTGIVCLFTLL